MWRRFSMRKDINMVIKTIREINNLSISDFAKIAKIDKNELKNMENGSILPKIETIFNICTYFHLPVDSLIGEHSAPASSRDLIEVSVERVTPKNNNEFLYAIFDKQKSVFLTPHLFDRIILSECGLHIGIRTNEDKIDQNGERMIDGIGEINYSCVIDNYGNIFEFPEWRFGYSVFGMMFGGHGKFFENVAPAYSLKDDLVYLVKFDGEHLTTISVGYKDIFYVAAGVFKARKDEKTIGGSDNQQIALYYDGTEITDIDFLQEDEENIDNASDELGSEEFEKIIAAVKKYGAGILKLAPSKTFELAENYYKIIFALEEFEKSNGYTGIKKGFQVGIGISILMREARHKKPILNLQNLPTDALHSDYYDQPHLKRLLHKIKRLLIELGYDNVHFYEERPIK